MNWILRRFAAITKRWRHTLSIQLKINMRFGVFIDLAVSSHFAQLKHLLGAQCRNQSNQFPKMLRSGLILCGIKYQKSIAVATSWLSHSWSVYRQVFMCTKRGLDAFYGKKSTQTWMRYHEMTGRLSCWLYTRSVVNCDKAMRCCSDVSSKNNLS